MAAAVLWAAVNELLIQPVEYTCYNLALEKVRCRWRPHYPSSKGLSHIASAAVSAYCRARAEITPVAMNKLQHWGGSDSQRVASHTVYRVPGALDLACATRHDDVAFSVHWSCLCGTNSMMS